MADHGHQLEPLLPSEVKLLERNHKNFEHLLLSDLRGEDSGIGSPNVYALTIGENGQNVGIKSSWKVLYEALWRTPYTDYADEWISTAMFNTKQFLVRSFNKMIKNSNNGRKFNMILLNDENWSLYDKNTMKNEGEIRLME